MVTSMVILVVYAIYVLPGTSERYAPVAAVFWSGTLAFISFPLSPKSE
jgi:hypothetical protein